MTDIEKLKGRRFVLPGKPEVTILTDTGQCERLICGKPELGKNVWVGQWVELDADHARLKIGDGTTICAGAKIYTHSNEHNITMGLPTKGNPGFVGEVIIGKCCFIGPNVVIEPDVEIGDRVKVGANSFVRRGTRIPSSQTWAGCPAVYMPKLDGVKKR